MISPVKGSKAPCFLPAFIVSETSLSDVLWVSYWLMLVMGKSATIHAYTKDLNLPSISVICQYFYLIRDFWKPITEFENNSSFSLAVMLFMRPRTHYKTLLPIWILIFGSGTKHFRVVCWERKKQLSMNTIFGTIFKNMV